MLIIGIIIIATAIATCICIVWPMEDTTQLSTQQPSDEPKRTKKKFERMNEGTSTQINEIK